MTYPQAIFLAIIQGLTEFLPISSSGHLVISQKLLGLKPPILFDILVHVGTLGTIIIYFWKPLLKISKQTVSMVVIGTIPAAVAGLFLQRYIAQIFDSLRLVGMTLLITAGLLFSSCQFKSLNKQKRLFKYLKWKDALFIGIFQALAILPGISRSGSTIVFGLWRGFDRETAFRFSFYLAIPAILGALVLKSKELMAYSSNEIAQGLIGMLIAGIVGYFALRILESILKQAKLFWFGIYCLILGIIILLV